MSGAGTLPTVNSFQNPNIPNTLLIQPLSALRAGSYALTSSAGATDWTDNANPLSSLFVGISVADTTPPQGLAIGSTTGISINGGNSTTHSLLVNLALSASDDTAVADMWVSNSNTFSDGAWESYTTSKPNWTLSGSSSGTKTVYVKFRDFAGNVSSIYSASILYGSGYDYVDFTVPVNLYTSGSSITLSGDCNSLSGSTVLVFTTATGTTMAGVCIDRSWTQTFLLVANTVNILRTSFADEPSVSGSITITQSTVGVTGGITINGSSARTKNPNVVVSLSGSSPVGVRRMLLGGDIDSGSTGWQSYSATKNIPLSVGDGTKTITIMFEDNALNDSPVYHASIILDTTPPVVTLSSSGGTFTSAQTVRISTNETASAYYVLNNPSLDPVASGTLYTQPLTISTGTVLTAEAIDLAGNISTKQTITFTINIPAPTPTPTPNGGGGG